MIGVLIVSSLLNVAYLLPIPIRAFLSPPPGKEYTGIQEAPWPQVAALSFTALLVIVLFFLANPIYEFLLPIADAAGGVK